MTPAGIVHEWRAICTLRTRSVPLIPTPLSLSQEMKPLHRTLGGKVVHGKGPPLPSPRKVRLEIPLRAKGTSPSLLFHSSSSSS